ncbi:PAS domain S-box-containing protein [Duganella sp. 1224]|uniref:PAS domain-containing sensor histidine kinase n=1 Tax=Duganella sp. 1224 TaxID=2587052 RepID=UPI0015CC50EF|nr:PAS domain-containing protein [Duganella sp. 1224]NYE60969.1 PAS domain S-box-containing protein [Duganella sp. 1224]
MNPFAFPPYVEISQVMGWLQAETGEPLLSGEAELRNIIALMPHPLFIKNARSQLVMMNPACEALWGVRFADVAGTDGSGKLPDDQVAMLREHDRQAFSDGATRIDEAQVWNCGRAEMRWLLIHKRPTYDAHGRPHLLIASCIDITGRKRSETALAAVLQQQDATTHQHRRIALGIQNDLAQNLLALKLDIDLLHGRTRAHQPRLHARAAQALETLNTSIAAVREVINELHPATLELGLAAAIEWQLQQIKQRHGLPYQLRILNDSATLDAPRTSALFHAVQAALSQLKDSASLLAITLDLRHPRTTVAIHSGHRGAPPDLTPMRAHLAAINGELAFRDGTLEIQLPT